MKVEKNLASTKGLGNLFLAGVKQTTYLSVQKICIEIIGLWKGFYPVVESKAPANHPYVRVSVSNYKLQRKKKEEEVL